MRRGNIDVSRAYLSGLFSGLLSRPWVGFSGGFMWDVEYRHTSRSVWMPLEFCADFRGN